MATHIAPNNGLPFYTGTHGNSSLAHNKFTCRNITEASDVVIMNVPIGTCITGFRFFTGVIGNTASIGAEIRQKGNDANSVTLMEALRVNTERNEDIKFAPIYINEPSELVLTLKVTSSSVNGDVDVVIEYMSVGY